MAGRNKGGKGLGRYTAEMEKDDREREQAYRLQEMMDDLSVKQIKKIKKRIAPTLIAPLATSVSKQAQEEDDDKGPIGPRRAKKRIAGPQLSKALGILKELHKKHTNPWVHHVRTFAEKNKMSYGCALSNPEIKAGYEKGKFTRPSDVKTLPEKDCGPATASKKRKAKGKGEEDEAKKHLKFLNKLAGGDYEGNVAKRRKDRMEGGGIGASFISNLEKRAAEASYGKGFKGFNI